jgi:UDP-glucose 4-epimerase
MKILITGISGFIGSNVAIKLSQLGHEIYGVDSLKFGYVENLNGIPVRWSKKSFTNIPQELLDSYDVLIHLATDNLIYAQTNVIDTFKTNSIDTIKLIDRFKGKIIYTSTCSIYGNASVYPTPENANDDINNAYDQSKLTVEKYLHVRGDYTTLRLSNVYGPNQRPDNPFCGVVARFIKNCIDMKPFDINGDGRSTRDFTYVDDVVESVVLACDQKAKNTEINIATGVETSTIKLAFFIQNIMETEFSMINHANSFSINYIPNRSIDGISRRCLDNRRAKELFGWEPKVPLKEGIVKTIDWIKANYR